MRVETYHSGREKKGYVSQSKLGLSWSVYIMISVSGEKGMSFQSVYDISPQ